MSNIDKSLVITKPIIYGSVAFWLGKKADESVSHKWSVYVRGENNEDISYFVKEVTFTLHTSFEQNVRTITKPPFELYESGWGEFDIKITIQLIDESIKPIEFIHPLKLYPSQQHVSLSIKKPIVSETYDEIIFVNPNPKLREILSYVPVKKEYYNIVQMSVDDDYLSDEKKTIISKKNEDDYVKNIEKDVDMMKVEDEGSQMHIEEEKNCETISMSLYSNKNEVI